MRVGISSACLYPDYLTEDAVLQLEHSGAEAVEVFLESYSEYSVEFCCRVRERLDRSGLKAYSVHVLSTQYEQQLFALTERQRTDALKYYEAVLKGAAVLGAEVYVFHGPSERVGREYRHRLEQTADMTDRLADAAGEYGIRFAWENVFWCWFCYPDFAPDLIQSTSSKNIWFTYDNKQAIRSRCDPFDFVKKMGSRIVNVHVSDFTPDGKMCLPGEGVFDFQRLYGLLKKQRCETPVLVEVYRENYRTREALFGAIQVIKDIFKD